jgi:hypothetical protein
MPQRFRQWPESGTSGRGIKCGAAGLDRMIPALSAYIATSWARFDGSLPLSLPLSVFVLNSTN